ncbi:MAG TPA: phasin family protein [Vicinamibacterales bacterium]|nr:phasin family protein [Acidobacteriota bacterium]HOC18049.1 phasin family protein [Vicinamibacterales bacterium]
MVEALRKLLLAGLGTLDLTEEKARAVFNELVARGEMSEKDAREVFATWSKRAGEQRGRMQQDIDAAVTKALSAMGLVRRSEVEALRGRIADLEQRLGMAPAEAEAAAEPAPPPDVDRSGN